MIDQILTSSMLGLSAVLDKQTEDWYRRGVNLFYAGISQMSAVDSAMTQIALVLTVSESQKTIPSWITYSGYLAPIAVGIIASRIHPRKDSLLKAVVLPIHKYIGTASHVAILISSLALIRLKKPILGAIPIVFIIYGFAQRRNLISNKIHQVFKNVSFAVVNTLRITHGSSIQKAYAIFYVSIELNAAFIKKQNKARLANLPKFEKNFSFEGFRSRIQEFLYDRNLDFREDLFPFVDNNLMPQRYSLSQLNLEINPSRVFENLVPPPPRESLKSLKWMFESVHWNKERMKEIVTSDIHWEMFYSEQTSDKQIFEYVEKGINTLVDNVQGRSERSGEFVLESLLDLKSRLKHIIAALRKKDEATRADILIFLGLTSNYCPQAYTQRIKMCYNALCSYVNENTAAGKLAHIFHMDRLHQFDILFNSTQQNLTWYQKIYTVIDEMHAYNHFAYLLGNEFNLPSNAFVENDELATPIPLESFLYKWYYMDDLDRFKDNYTPDYVFRLARDAVDKGALNYEKLENWLVLNLFPEETRGTAIKRIKNEVYDNSSKIRPIYLVYFLVKESFFIWKKTPSNGAKMATPYIKRTVPRSKTR